MKIYDMDQRSQEWRDARLGIPTASQASRIITNEGKPSRQVRKYLYEKVYERIFRRPWSKDLTNVMAVQEGIRNEPIAADHFTATVGLPLETIGFCTTDDGMWGCSPDRLVVGRHEIVEIKCPQPPTLIGYIIDGIESEYNPQMQMQMLIGGWHRCHFYAYGTEIAPFYRVIERDIAFQSKLAGMLRDFVHETLRCEQIVLKHGVYPKDAGSNMPEPIEDEVEL